MADEIKANYDELEQIASQFANQSQEIQQMLQKVNRSLGTLVDGGWEGEAADDFFEVMNSEVLPASGRLQEALNEASRTTNDIVQTVQQAEEEASSRFRVG